jgi:ATP-dependent DNA ligase
MHPSFGLMADAEATKPTENVKPTAASTMVEPSSGMVQGFVVALLTPIKFRSGDDGTLAIYHPLPLRLEAVAQIEFLDWTAGDRLRHSKFVGLRDDKDARSVVKEQP